MKDIKECCKGHGGGMVGGQFKEKRDEKEEMINIDKSKIRNSRRRMSQVRH